MLVSHAWLQTYFKDKLPDAEKLADLLTFHAFEIESIQKAESGMPNDTTIDVKVLPDRAHYALSHRGIAYEVAAITKMEEMEKKPAEILVSISEAVAVQNLEPEACLRYMARYIKDVKAGESPEWLVERLAAVGQRSINSVVDAANFVMLDMGQPLHCFDADKLAGSITVRKAKKGEHITTLDGKEVALDETVLVIADEKGPLAIAGIKGGNRAAVTASTKNLILESATFAHGIIRKTSQKIGIRTDSSKRYENEITTLFARLGIEALTRLIMEMNPGASVGPVIDIYPNHQKETVIAVELSYIQTLLGVQISNEECEDIFRRLKFTFKKEGDVFHITIPPYRLDLTIKQDIVEEVGRIYGYDKIPAAELPATSFKPGIQKEYYYANKVRDFLVERGFSEVYTYSLVAKVENEKGVELINPLASDKNFLRDSLELGILKSLEINLRRSDLLGLNEIKIFEIGTVFEKDEEYTQLALAFHKVKKTKGENNFLAEIVQGLLEFIGFKTSANIETYSSLVVSRPDRVLINLSEVIKQLSQPTIYEPSPIKPLNKPFQAISLYPFIARDIAVFTPQGTSQNDVETLIKKNAGTLLVRLGLFDVFEKPFQDGTVKTSYAFRLVFQSRERTLTDEEANAIMRTITDEMNSKAGWEVR
jgi:phenylalanyl-tRNA synthetase beta chain